MNVQEIAEYTRVVAADESIHPQDRMAAALFMAIIDKYERAYRTLTPFARVLSVQEACDAIATARQVALELAEDFPDGKPGTDRATSA